VSDPTPSAAPPGAAPPASAGGGAPPPVGPSPPGSGPPDPSGAASGAVTDPGFTVTDLPVNPSPGAPTADANNVMTIFVPTDSTTLQMGASSAGPNLATAAISGFRVSTLNHVHLTAQTPITTISLGQPGGQGMPGVAGLSVYTEGQKQEHVVLDVNEWYDLKKTEHVKADVTENYDQKKSETVGGELHEIYKDKKTEDITGPLTATITNEASYTYKSGLFIDSKNRHEHVHGNWTISPIEGDLTIDPINGNLFIHAKGTAKLQGDSNMDWIQAGDLKHVFMGAHAKIIVGTDSSVNVANKNSVTLGVASDTRVGAHIDTRAGLHVQSMYGVRIEKKGINLDSNGALDSVKSAARVVKLTAGLLYSATIYAFK
jgi:hypothetical protein